MGAYLRTHSTFFLALLLLGLSVISTHAEKRIALVIGNDNYENVVALQKANNDASAIARTLESVGYKVLLAHDVTRRQMNRQLLQFESQIEPGDEALFYYAGHGVEIDGRNYLLPTDIPGAEVGQEDFIISEAVAVDTVLDRIRSRSARVAILILDACRDNPFPRTGTRSLGNSRGLAGTAAPEGTFIMYSAGVGQTALDRLSNDDPNPNSVFTRSLIPLLKTPGLSLTRTAREVRRDVQKLASAVSHDQRPAYYDEVTGDFFFAGPGEGKAVPASVSADPAAQAWEAIQSTKSAAMLKSFISHFPDSVYADFAKVRLKEIDTARLASLEQPAARPDAANEGGATEHGWLGVQIRDVTKDVADSVGYEGTRGALVVELPEGSPAGKAGIAVGDIIVSVDDRQIDDPISLARQVGSLAPGTEVRFGVWNATTKGSTLGAMNLGSMPPELKTFFKQFDSSKDKLRIVSVRLGSRPAQPAEAAEPSRRQGAFDFSRLGIELEPSETGEGVLVASVVSSSEAESKGIKSGDIIVSVDNRDVSSPSDVAAAVEEARQKNHRALLIRITQNNGSRFLSLAVDAK